MMMAWTAVILTICLAPIGIWAFDRALGARRKKQFEQRAGRRRLSESADLNATPATS